MPTRSSVSDKKSGIYKITNEITGDFYIGSSADIHVRWRGHRYTAKLPVRPTRSYLYASIDEYGIEAFRFEIVEEVEPVKKTLLEREQHYIDYWQPVLNLMPIAGSRLGSKWSAETMAHMKRVMAGKGLGRKLTPEHCAAIWSNRVILDSTRELQRQAKLGHVQSPEQIEKRMQHIRGVSKTKEHYKKVLNTRRINKNANLIEQAEQNRKSSFIKNDTREETRQFKDEQVRSIRQDERYIVVIAAEYGVSPATIKKIKVRKTYQDVPDEGPVSKDIVLSEQTTTITVFGIEYESVQAACAAIKVPVKTSMIYYRLSHGMTPDQAFTLREPVEEWLSQFKHVCNHRYTASDLFDDYKAFEKSWLDGSGIDLSKQKWSNEFSKLINASKVIRKYRTSSNLYYIFE